MSWHRWEKISQSHLKIWQKYVMHWNRTPNDVFSFKEGGNE